MKPPPRRTRSVPSYRQIRRGRTSAQGFGETPSGTGLETWHTGQSESRRTSVQVPHRVSVKPPKGLTAVRNPRGLMANSMENRRFKGVKHDGIGTPWRPIPPASPSSFPFLPFPLPSPPSRPFSARLAQEHELCNRFQAAAGLASSSIRG